MMSRQHVRFALALVGGAAFVATALAASPASAKKPLQVVVEDESEVPPPPPDPPSPPPPPPSPHHEGAGALFFGFGSMGAIEGLGFAPAGDSVEPDPLKKKHLRLEGGGQIGGGGLRVDIFGRYARGGVTLSVFGVDHTRLEHSGLENGFTASASSAWGAGFEVFAGYEFLKGPVRPYMDLTTAVNIFSMQVDLNHPRYGRLGRTQYEAWLFGFGPRLGVSVPLGGSAYFDVSATYQVIGTETLRVTSGIGFWNR